MHIYYPAIQLTILIELFALIVLVAFVIILNLTYLTKKRNFVTKRKDTFFDLIAQFFSQGIPENAEARVPGKYRKLAILLPVIARHDKASSNNPVWKTLRSYLITTYVIPLALPDLNSFFKEKRLVSMQSFTLSPESLDARSLENCFFDKVSLVRLIAAKMAIKRDLDQLISIIISQCVENAHFLRERYIALFKSAAPSVFSGLVKRLRIENRDKHRAICYKILLLFSNVKEYPGLEKDFVSEDQELRLFAIQAVAKIKDNSYLLRLESLLKHEAWKIRAESINTLRFLNPNNLLEMAKHLLTDPIWWVRIQAAQAFSECGKEGKKILQESINPDAPDAADYILKLELN